MTEASPTTAEEYDDATSQSDESDEIAARYRDQLSLRGHRSPFSPDFLNRQPRSALEKLRISAEEEENVLYLYAGTYSLHQTAASAGISLEKVRAIVYSPSASQKIQAYRDQMRVSVLQKIEEAQVVLLDSMQDPSKLADSSITQISDVFVEISGVQSNLVSSLRESAGHTTIDPVDVLDGEDLEYLALLRRRLSVGPQSQSTEDLYSYESSPSAISAEFSLGDSENLDPPDVPSGEDSLDLASHDDPGVEADFSVDVQPFGSEADE